MQPPCGEADSTSPSACSSRAAESWSRQLVDALTSIVMPLLHATHEQAQRRGSRFPQLEVTQTGMQTAQGTERPKTGLLRSQRITCSSCRNLHRSMRLDGNTQSAVVSEPWHDASTMYLHAALQPAGNHGQSQQCLQPRINHLSVPVHDTSVSHIWHSYNTATATYAKACMLHLCCTQQTYGNTHPAPAVGWQLRPRT